MKQGDASRRSALRWLAGVSTGPSLAAPGRPAAAAEGEPIFVRLDRASATPRSLAPAFLGFNANLVAVHAPWRDLRLLDVLKQMQPGNLRYPGGTVANYWNWSDGAVDRRFRPSDLGVSKGLLRQAAGNGGYTLENLAIAVSATGAVPVFVANMLLYDVEEQIAHLRRARSLGLPIRFVELGNEFYFGRGAHPAVFEKYPTVEAYGAAVRRWSRRIKAEFPGVKVSAVATGPMRDNRKSERRLEWDRRLFSQIDGVDAISVHLYASAGLDEPDAGNSASVWGTPEQQRAQAARLRTAEGVQELIGRTTAFVVEKLRDDHYPRGLELWITEFNVIERVGALRGSWAHGLAVAAFVDAFLRHPSVALACYHNFFAQAMFTAVWKPSNEFRQSVLDVDAAPQPYAANGAGVVMSFLLSALRGVTAASPILVSPYFASDRRATSPSLLGGVRAWLLTKAGEERTMLLNLTGQPVQCVTSGEASRTVTLKQLTSIQLNVRISSRVAAVESRHPTHLPITVGAFSLSILSLS